MNYQHEGDCQKNSNAYGLYICLIIVMLFLPTCAAQSDPVPQGAQVIWEGSVDDRPETKEAFDKTVECLNQNFGIQQPKPHPKLALMNDEFMMNGGGPYDGYILFDPNIMYVRDSSREQWIVSHETVHWMYQIGDSLHETPPYLVCQQYGAP